MLWRETSEKFQNDFKHELEEESDVIEEIVCDTGTDSTMNMSKADSFEEDIPVLEEEAWHKTHQQNQTIETHFCKTHLVRPLLAIQNKRIAKANKAKFQPAMLDIHNRETDVAFTSFGKKHTERYHQYQSSIRKARRNLEAVK